MRPTVTIFTVGMNPSFRAAGWHGPAVGWRQSLPWIAIVMLGVVSHGRQGYLLYFRLIADIGPAALAVGDLFDPTFAALWGYLCLGETVEEGLILGALLVCVALWMIIVPSGRKRGVPDGA